MKHVQNRTHPSLLTHSQLQTIVDNMAIKSISSESFDEARSDMQDFFSQSGILLRQYTKQNKEWEYTGDRLFSTMTSDKVELKGQRQFIILLHHEKPLRLGYNTNAEELSQYSFDSKTRLYFKIQKKKNTVEFLYELF